MNLSFRERVKSVLVDEYDKLLAYSEYYLNQRFFGAEAEDIIQDVALNLFSRPDISAPVENISSYIYRSIRNRIRDLYRKKEPHESLENSGHYEKEDFSEDEIEEDLFLEEISENLRSAFLELSPDQQAIIDATIYNGETFESLSKRWGIPIGTLLARKHRAITKLRKELNKQ